MGLKNVIFCFFECIFAVFSLILVTRTGMGRFLRYSKHFLGGTRSLIKGSLQLVSGSLHCVSGGLHSVFGSPAGCLGVFATCVFGFQQRVLGNKFLGWFPEGLFRFVEYMQNWFSGLHAASFGSSNNYVSERKRIGYLQKATGFRREFQQHLLNPSRGDVCRRGMDTKGSRFAEPMLGEDR